MGHRELKRYNLVIAESEEYLMAMVLARMKSKERPRENKADRKQLNLDRKVVTRRTFLCTAPKLLLASTVAQSTTEAVRSSSASSSNYLAHAPWWKSSSAGLWD